MKKVKATILTSSETHPVYPYLVDLRHKVRNKFDLKIETDRNKLNKGDLLILVSCHEIIKQEHRSMFTNTLVLHASDLPAGRGWSPHIWQILEGKNDITLSMIEAEDKVDTGDIIKQQKIYFEGTELYEEINHKIFSEEINLIEYALTEFGKFKPFEQKKRIATYYEKRTPKDSEVKPDSKIKDIFNLLRVADKDRYPVFFKYKGVKFKLHIEKISDD